MINEVTSHLHPILVHFPIAFITLAVLKDFWSAFFKKVNFQAERGMWLWIFAALSAWLSVSTGPEEMARGNTTFLHIHDQLAILTSWLVTIVAIFRIYSTYFNKKELFNKLKFLYLIFSLASLILVLSVGYYGGKMVYTDGINVKVHNKLVNPPK